MIASYKGIAPVIHEEAFIASKPFQQPAKNYLVHSAGHRKIEIL